MFEDQVLLGYTGLDHKLRQTRVTFDPAPAKLTASMAEFTLDLAPGQTAILFMQTDCSGLEARASGRRTFFHAMVSARRSLRRW